MLTPKRNPLYERCLLEERQARAKVRYLKGQKYDLIRKVIRSFIRARYRSHYLSPKAWFTMNFISREFK